MVTAYNDTYYVSQIKLDEEDATTIIEQDRKKTEDALWREVERVKVRAEAEGAIRQPIPEAIQVLVWNRDQGKCVKCGSKENLEFDHIIPLSKGEAIRRETFNCSARNAIDLKVVRLAASAEFPLICPAADWL
jgi:5-methylcytosine-specific restriction endonuclease McrA